jgi:hypothetical protein
MGSGKGFVMRVLQVLAVVLALLPVSARAQGVDAEIRGVIQGQIDAFGANDVATAFSYASPMIQGLFGTPENFGMMVQQGYPMVWRPGAVRFEGLREQGGRKVQSVFITDLQGRDFIADYEMIETPEGWQINGVTIREAEGVGV